jgi:hypothetical protein
VRTLRAFSAFVLAKTTLSGFLVTPKEGDFFPFFLGCEKDAARHF